jgi:hypothetical protein
MKNRAKCRKCESIIESFYDDDFVSCKCGSIFVDGGAAMRCGADDWSNFLRVDDAGNIIIPVIQMQPDDNRKPDSKSRDERKQERLVVLRDMIKHFESLPPQVMSHPIDHYDFVSLLLFIESLVTDV